MKKIVRKVAAFAIYIPPETKKPSLDELGEVEEKGRGKRTRPSAEK